MGSPSVATLKSATLPGSRGSMYCVTVPPGMAAAAASASVETGSQSPVMATLVRSPLSSEVALTQSMMRPVVASMMRKGATKRPA